MDNSTLLAKGGCERIGTAGNITHKVPGRDDFKEDIDLPTHDEALREVFRLLTDKQYGVLNSVDEIDAVGHRVAHGGERFKKSSIVDDDAIAYLESIVPINPLHGPAAIKGMKACKALLPNTLQAATFDTSFYANFKPSRYIYALPYECYTEDGVRRYGFHGTSHRFVSQKAAEFLGKPLNTLKMITCHLGNGSSITAIDKGIAVDTSMGFTPQEGILMGTRSGSIDPTIIPYLMKRRNLTPEQMDDLLNKKSGLLGVTGISNDSRNCEEAALAGNERANLALDILYDGIKKYIGGYTAELNGLDVLVFTAGIGENSPIIREKVCSDMDYLGIKIDKSKNDNFKRGSINDISASDSKVKVLVIPTNEEYMIALDTKELYDKR